MLKKKKVETSELEEYKKTGMYKGYSINWLRETPDHADYHLVAEVDALMEGGN